MSLLVTPAEAAALLGLEPDGRRLIPNGPVSIKPTGAVVGKYHNQRCSAHTPAHASRKECRRYAELVLLERAGKIRNLRQQQRVRLCDCAKRPLVWVADFVYEEPLGAPAPRHCWRLVYEDVKGGTATQTAAFRLKRHLLAHQGIEVRVI